MLAHEIDRLRDARRLTEVVIATTEKDEDEPLVQVAESGGVAWFRGPESDVLGRVLGAAGAHGADVVVRLTGDCPLVDPGVVDLVIDRLLAGDAEYASNVLRRTYPRGLDVEAMTIGALRRADAASTTDEDREHVTLAMRRGDGAFRTHSVEDDTDNSDLRLTVDEPADLRLIRALFDALEQDGSMPSYRSIVAHLREHPELRAINAGVETWSPAPAARGNVA
jgi:spore coat polysaccharide biosynthesis protein SpsF